MYAGASMLSPIWYHVTDLVVDHGLGAYVYTTGGEQYLDFTSGIGVTSTGHCHPRVVKAIQDQAARMIHAQINVYYHEPAFRLAQALMAFTPDGIDSFFFANSGAEAVEAAVKLARHGTRKANIIVFRGGFHGRTGQATAMTSSKASYRVGYQPLPSGVVFAPFPDAYRYGWDAEETSAFCLRELDFILHSESAPEDTAAIIVEPVLGEGGYVVPPRSFIRGLREICDANGILLIADEVQSGAGRTGKFFAH
jgi:4-aminobutyrate aminotransferase